MSQQVEELEWTIETNNGTRTLAELGVDDLRIVFRNREADEATFSVPGDFTSRIGMTAGNVYRIRHGESIVFAGRFSAVTRSASGGEEGVEAHLLGPWHDLEQVVYAQNWGGNTPNAHKSKTRVILGCGDDGEPISIDAQLEAIVRYAASHGANISSSVSTGVSVGNIPMDEQLDLTCAEAINRVLAWCPGTAVSFSYAGSVPSIRFRKAATGRFDATVAVADCESAQAMPRYDIQIPGVKIIFESTSDKDGEIVVQTREQTAGNPSALGALVATIPLDGGLKRHLFQQIKSSDPYPSSLAHTNSSPNTEAFQLWKKWFPWLKRQDYLANCNPAITHVEFTDEDGNEIEWPPAFGSPADPKNRQICNRELLEGQISDWMEHKAVTVRIEARVSYATLSESLTSREISHTLVMTSAKSGVYKAVYEEREAEPEPQGLAANLYANLGALQHEGRCVLVGSGHFSVARPGDAIRLSGGPDDWATMNAVVQSVELDVAAERTTVSFGPPARLGPQDLFQFLQANRRRGDPSSRSEKTAPQVPAGEDESPGSQQPSGGDDRNMLFRNTLGGLAPASDSAPGRSTFAKLHFAPESDDDPNATSLDVGPTGLVLTRNGQTVAVWPGDLLNYGFVVWLAEDEHGTMRVHVKAGTAQFWGGAVKTYAEADLGAAVDGNYVFARLALAAGWDDDLSYGDMDGQDADEEIFIPIALTTQDEDEIWNVVQMHWGNIVIPAVTNAVDVQSQPVQQQQPSS